MIRPYADSDLSQVLDVWYRASLVGHPFLDEAFFETERRLIAEEWLPVAETIVVEDQGRVVGYLALNDNEVGAVFVDPDHHRRGIGRALMHRARQLRPFLEVEVFEANPVGPAFYLACGFKVVDRYVNEDTGQPALLLRLGTAPAAAGAEDDVSNSRRNTMQPAKAPTISVQGAVMPVVGYGTMLYPEPERAVGLIVHALEYGYRHIDTARKYGSEQWVGEGLRASGLPRDELWVTTKVTEENARADDFARSVDTSLETLGIDYVDLLLIHWPQPLVPLEETLGALAKAKNQGLTRHIGVSNFNVALLDEAVSKCSEPILLNQVEYHAYLRQDKLLAACERHDMLVTCHVPLARGRLLDDPVINEIASAHDKTAAQVALRFLVQQPQIAVVPRALEFSEIEEDIDIFDFVLTDEEMDRIGELRDKSIRIVDPESRRPVWDVG